MRIVYLHQYFNTPEMAGATRSYEIARRLVRAGHDVHMVTTWREPTDGRGWYTSDESGIQVHWLRLPYANSMAHSRRIAAFVRFALSAARRAAALDADVLLATSTPLTIVIPAMLVSRLREIPFVFEVRDMWPDVPIALGVLRQPLAIAASRKLESLAYQRAQHIIALAPGMRSDIIAKGVPADKVTVVPNGCDFDLFSGQSDRDVRREHSWLGRRKLVVYAGAIGQANGVDYLVHVAACMRAADPEVRFVVFGTGSQSEFVRRLAQEKAVLGETFFMFPPLPKTTLVPWLKAADIHLALMRGPAVYVKDAVNNKFFDALAAGKPIANNFHGWQTELAGSADVGVHLHETDHEVAAQTLLGALGDETWLAGVRERALSLAAGRFDRDSHASAIEDVLLRAIEKRRR